MPRPPAPAGDRSDLLASIRAAGGTGGLRKVRDEEKKDRSAAMVPGQESSVNGGGDANGSGGAEAGGMMGALQAALNKRKQRVSGSG